MLLCTSLLSFACIRLLGHGTALPPPNDTKTVEGDIDDPLSPYDGHFKYKQCIDAITDQHRADTGLTMESKDLRCFEREGKDVPSQLSLVPSTICRHPCAMWYES